MPHQEIEPSIHPPVPVANQKLPGLRPRFIPSFCTSFPIYAPGVPERHMRLNRHAALLAGDETDQQDAWLQLNPGQPHHSQHLL